MASKRYKDDDSPFTPAGDLEDESILDEILMDGDDEESPEESPAENFDDDDAPDKETDDDLEEEKDDILN
jgi:hypothetical protein